MLSCAADTNRRDKITIAQVGSLQYTYSPTQNNGQIVKQNDLGNRTSASVTKGSAPYGNWFYDSGTNRMGGYSYDANGNIYRDSTAGLDYAQNRYYASTLARFTSPDPYNSPSVGSSDPSSWNRYSYTAGDPINRHDTTGMYWEGDSLEQGPGGDRGGGGDKWIRGAGLAFFDNSQATNDKNQKLIIDKCIK
jgi:RHS repeat-associated protein